MTAILFNLECEDEWKMHGSKCFKYLEKQIGNGTWYDAMELCKKSKSNLASVNSVNEQAFIAYMFMHNHNKAWIGGTVANNSIDHWKDGSPVNYSNFYTSSPSDGCIQMYYTGSMWKWTAHDCSKEYFHDKPAIVCKKKANISVKV